MKTTWNPYTTKSLVLYRSAEWALWLTFEQRDLDELKTPVNSNSEEIKILNAEDDKALHKREMI